MEIIKSDNIDFFKEQIQLGKVVAFPTETSYGLGCDATNSSSIDRVISIKQRAPDKGLPVLISPLDKVDNYIITNPIIQEISKKHWPGALNIIGRISANSKIASQCSKDNFQAIRISSHPFIQNFHQISQIPLVATSANLSDHPASYSAEEILNQFKNQEYKPDFIVDGGQLPKNPASTMIKVTDNGFEVIRFGSIII